MSNQILAKILANPRYKANERQDIEKAFNFAENAHRGQKRLSGDDYIIHPLKTALFLSDMNLDSRAVSAGLLHDVIEDTNITHEDLAKEFGNEVAFLVKGVTKLGKLEYSEQPLLKRVRSEDHYNSLKRMFLAMAEDVRVILIKLADRYHNMETLNHLPQPDQKRIASETLEIYAPIAARLGIGKIKGQLEDLAFPFVYPDDYSRLIKEVKERYTDRLNYIEKTSPIIAKHLEDAGIKILDLHSRAKHYYSLYQKTVKKKKELDHVFDLVAMRLIVPDIKSCYEALGVLHNQYRPVPGLIKDYIALPKPNGYQSLHTTIFCEGGRVVEIQIRTPEIHEYAENGIAAHWAYSENKKAILASVKEVDWITQLKNFLSNTEGGESISNLKIDFFKNRIFVLTPKGDVKDLPEGSTPIDFAYSIHTGLGESIMGAKVNGKMVPISYKLNNSDVVEIIKGKNIHPSMDWLKMVKTAEARRQIKSYLLGSEASKSKLPSRSTELKRPKITTKKQAKTQTAQAGAIQGEPLIDGQKGVLYKIARCCKPTIQDKIQGYMTLNRGISIHTATCANIRNLARKRLIPVSWGHS